MQTLVTTQHAEICNISEEVLDLLPRRQGQAALRLGQTAIEQCKQLQQIYLRQRQMTDTDPLQSLQTTDSGSHRIFHAAQQQDQSQSLPSSIGLKSEINELVGNAAQPAVTSIGKVARLTDSQELTLLAFFSLQDSLTREATAHLAEKVNCSEKQVQEYFTRLKKSVRDYLHKLQRKSYDVPVGSHANPSNPGIPSASNARREVIDLEDERFNGNGSQQDQMQEQQAKADGLRSDALNTLQQAIKDAHIANVDGAEIVANTMRHTRSWCVRQNCLQAIAATRNQTILTKMLHSVHLLAMLSSWIDEAVQSGQHSCLRAILMALKQFNLKEKDLKFNDLPKKIAGLQNHGAAHVGKMAKELLREWGVLSAPAKIIKNAGALDPVASAVALKKKEQVQAPVRPSIKPPETVKKRPQGTAAGPQVQEKAAGTANVAVKPPSGSGSRLWPSKAVPPSAAPKPSRLDLSALGNIKSARNQPISKPTAHPRQEAALQQYKTLQAYLATMTEQVKQQEELTIQSKVLAALKWNAKLCSWYSPLATKLHDFGIGNGEESEERKTLNIKHKHKGRGNSHQLGQAPREPMYEPELPSKQTEIPFLPIDPGELKLQYEKMKMDGLLLEHLVPASYFPLQQSAKLQFSGRPQTHPVVPPKHTAGQKLQFPPPAQPHSSQYTYNNGQTPYNYSQPPYR